MVWGSFKLKILTQMLGFISWTQNLNVRIFLWSTPGTSFDSYRSVSPWLKSVKKSKYTHSSIVSWRVFSLFILVKRFQQWNGKKTWNERCLFSLMCDLVIHASNKNNTINAISIRICQSFVKNRNRHTWINKHSEI